MSFSVLSTAKVFGGTMSRVKHASAVTKCDMVFAVFMPECAEGLKVPALYFLSGLTCDDTNFMGKSGAQRAAAKAGIALIAPDTSPRAYSTVPQPRPRTPAPAPRRAAPSVLRERSATPRSDPQSPPRCAAVRM